MNKERTKKESNGGVKDVKKASIRRPTCTWEVGDFSQGGVRRSRHSPRWGRRKLGSNDVLLVSRSKQGCHLFVVEDHEHRFSLHSAPGSCSKPAGFWLVHNLVSANMVRKFWISSQRRTQTLVGIWSLCFGVLQIKDNPKWRETEYKRRFLKYTIPFFKILRTLHRKKEGYMQSFYCAVFV